MSVVHDWFAANTFDHRQFGIDRLLAEKESQDLQLSVCLPAKEVANTIGPILEQLGNLKDVGLLDQVVVVDANSGDGTAEIVSSSFASVYQENELDQEVGPCQGKGDAMWRSLSVVDGDVVAFIDADSTNFGSHYVTGLFGPLLSDSSIDFVKGAYRRPFTTEGKRYPSGGGRVTELCARPLLNFFYPDLSGFMQPLAGEVAVRRELLDAISFSSGYTVEVAMLIDVYKTQGLDAMAQVDLGSRENSHQSLDRLGPMAYGVLKGVCSRLQNEGRMKDIDAEDFLKPIFDSGIELTEIGVEVIERPPRRAVEGVECRS